MKEKHWFVWIVFFVGIVMFKAIPGLRSGLSLSQLGLGSVLWPFVLGTIGTAIAFLWEFAEGHYVSWPKG